MLHSDIAHHALSRRDGYTHIQSRHKDSGRYTPVGLKKLQWQIPLRQTVVTAKLSINCHGNTFSLPWSLLRGEKPLGTANRDRDDSRFDLDRTVLLVGQAVASLQCFKGRCHYFCISTAIHA